MFNDGGDRPSNETFTCRRTYRRVYKRGSPTAFRIPTISACSDVAYSPAIERTPICNTTTRRWSDAYGTARAQQLTFSNFRFLIHFEHSPISSRYSMLQTVCSSIALGVRIRAFKRAFSSARRNRTHRRSARVD